MLRVDTYHPSYHLVDLWMYRELEDVSHSRGEMVAALTVLLEPWTVRVEDIRLEKDSYGKSLYSGPSEWINTIHVEAKLALILLQS